MIRSARVLLNFGARRRGFKAGRHEKPDFLTEFHRPAKAFLMANKLTKLGRQVRLPRSPDEAALERVANPHADTDYLIRFTAPEFTTLCPVTGQPDFAHFVIDYAPAKSIVESKSLKLYLASFRNHAAFHEACTLAIGKKIVAAIRPKYLRIAGYWYPRGGMPIDIFWQTGKLPADVWLPDTGVAPYRGRG
jgi:7-cyano-7-deazaguanine reductase